jgi:hypothetical protein
MSDAVQTEARQANAIEIFRRDDAPPSVSGPKAGLTEVSIAGLTSLREAGMADGAETRLLFQDHGFSLIHVWFKSGFPLFRHSHGPDCLYQVIGGSLRLGEEVLRKGDGFFLPRGTLYAFEVGPEGVELLEIRREPICDTVVRADNPAFWEKALETIRARRQIWLNEPRPT